MKKIIATIAVTGLALGAFAQGTILIQNTGSTDVTTNNGAGISGNLSGAGNYYFALLTAGAYTSGSLPTDNNKAAIVAGDWTFTGATATNTATAGRVVTGGSTAGTSVSDWAVETVNSYILVGWSTSLGSTWSAIDAELVSGSWNANGWFGISAVGSQESGGVDPTTSQTVNPGSIFGATENGPGAANLIPGFALSPATVVPEPTTLALGALGSLSLLALRRKKA